MENQESSVSKIKVLRGAPDPARRGNAATIYATRATRCRSHQRDLESPGRLPFALVHRTSTKHKGRCGFPTRFLTPPFPSSTARTLAACPPNQRNFLANLFHATRPDRLLRPHENRHWRHWALFAVSIGQHPLLPNTQTPTRHLERTLLFLASAVAMWQGRFHNDKCVRGAEVERALRECAQLMVAQGLEDPQKTDPANHCLARSITTYITSCKNDDPPALPQQAIPSSVIRWIATNMGCSQQPRTTLTAHLIVLAFFFLLRVGEYTPSWEKRRTIPLRKKDIQIWRAGTIIPNDSPLSVLATADAVTICLENQKNGHKNAVHHHTSPNDANLNPVKSAAFLVHALKNLPETTPVGSFVDKISPHWCRTWKLDSTRIHHRSHRLTQHPLRWRHAPQIGRLRQRHYTETRSLV
jgi:hypothetical protein